jgi:hypothetical protein
METNKLDAQILADSDVETWSYNISAFYRIVCLLDNGI